MARQTTLLLDTDILVALIRGNELGRRVETAYGLRDSPIRSVLSIVTVGETLSLSRQFGWGKAKLDAMSAMLDEFVQLDIDYPEVLEAYAEIDSESVTVGRTMGKNDVWIAATAKAANLSLLTTDKDFDHLDGKHITRIYVNPNAGRAGG